MRRAWVLTFILIVALDAVAATTISVQQLRQRVQDLQHKSDKAVAKQIAGMKLTERLSHADYVSLSRQLPGKESVQALTAIADAAAFLPPPPSPAAADAAPSPAEQGKILVRATEFVGKETNRMPNFLAERTTMRFQDAVAYPFSTQIRFFTPGQLHYMDTHSATVRYSKGKEEELSKRDRVKESTSDVALAPMGLTTWGAFGPLVEIVLSDVLQGKIGWDRWEGSGADRRAVFRFVVPVAKSHYTLEYCCTMKQVESKFEMTEFKATPAYHGWITIEPDTGHVVHIALVCDLAPKQVITRAGTELEYGPVEIAGQSYFLPRHGVSYSTALVAHPSGSIGTDHFLVTSVNDLQFDNYRVFRTEMKILPAETADKAPQ